VLSSASVTRWLLLLATPAVAGALLARPVADKVGTSVAEQLSALARLLPQRSEPAAEPEPVVPPLPAAAPDEGALETKPAAPPKRGAKGAYAKADRPAAPPSGLHVSKKVVLSLAERRVQPSGTPVPPEGERPAGIALHGVGALGLGVLDGDVLTEVEGRPARAPGQVIDAILRARGRRAPTISGVLYRGQHRFTLVVEQPY
jgi:hypothetical protein